MPKKKNIGCPQSWKTERRRGNSMCLCDNDNQVKKKEKKNRKGIGGWGKDNN